MTMTATDLRSLPTGELRSEILKRQRAAEKLRRDREKAAAKIVEIDQQLAELGVGGSGSVMQPRAKNDMSLVAALHKLLKGKEMGIPDMLPALKTVGYVSHSPNLRTMVNASLLKKNLFKRTGRGIYTAK